MSYNIESSWNGRPVSEEDEALYAAVTSLRVPLNMLDKARDDRTSHLIGHNATLFRSQNQRLAVEASGPGGGVMLLDRLAVELGGAPAYVRFDNGPEFIAHAVADWSRFNHTDSVFIDPGSPWQNAWVESFNGRFRDELLNGWQFDSLLEVRVIIETWRIDYNWERPHTAHGDLTPSEFAANWTTNNQPPGRIAPGPLIGSLSRS